MNLHRGKFAFLLSYKDRFRCDACHCSLYVGAVLECPSHEGAEKVSGGCILTSGDIVVW